MKYHIILVQILSYAQRIWYVGVYVYIHARADFFYPLIGVVPVNMHAHIDRYTKTCFIFDWQASYTRILSWSKMVDFMVWSSFWWLIRFKIHYHVTGGCRIFVWFSCFNTTITINLSPDTAVLCMCRMVLCMQLRTRRKWEEKMVNSLRDKWWMTEGWSWNGLGRNQPRKHRTKGKSQRPRAIHSHSLPQ